MALVTDETADEAGPAQSRGEGGSIRPESQIDLLAHGPGHDALYKLEDELSLKA